MQTTYSGHKAINIEIKIETNTPNYSENLRPPQVKILFNSLFFKVTNIPTYHFLTIFSVQSGFFKQKRI